MTSALGTDLRERRQLNYGDSIISYVLQFTDRKSLEISVYPDGAVVVKAPMIAALADVEAKIKKRARWIRKQLRYFAQFEPRTPPRKFVGGESHLYLGRSYRLKITSSDNDEVLLKGKFFRNYSPPPCSSFPRSPRHSRAGGNPVKKRPEGTPYKVSQATRLTDWIPACAGMTEGVQK